MGHFKLVMLNIYILILSIMSASYYSAQSFENNDFKANFEKKEGLIHGKYVSYYKNGNKKAEGVFENNIRTGIWTVWDSLGRMRMQREYFDLFTFKRLYPNYSNDTLIKLLNQPNYIIEYNKEGYLNYYDLNANAIFWSKRLWRFLEPQNNPHIFQNNILFNILNKNILDSSLQAYHPREDQFKHELKISELDTSSLVLLGFKIKEDCFIENERFLFETRIIGICPVVLNTITNDTLDLYWLYYPQIRKILAQQRISIPTLPPHIHTLDDLFIFRYFSGYIYNESYAILSNNIDRKFYEATLNMQTESELNLIEQEHDFWISFTSLNKDKKRNEK